VSQILLTKLGGMGISVPKSIRAWEKKEERDQAEDVTTGHYEKLGLKDGKRVGSELPVRGKTAS